MSPHRNKSRKGSAILEFGIIIGVLIPLLFGTITFGVNLGNMLQSFQISRDVAHMYAQGVDFSTSQNQDIAVNLVQGLGGMTKVGGQGVMILSQVRKVYDTDCIAGGLAANNAACPNMNAWVFSNRIVIGNTTLRASNFGTPSAPCTVTANGNISSADFLTQPACKTSGFDDSILVEAAGDIAYVVEAYFATPNLSFLGYGGGAAQGSYTRAIF